MCIAKYDVVNGTARIGHVYTLEDDGKLQAELLDNKGTLSNKIIEQYDYIELKNDFAEIVDILSTNMLVHAMYQEH